MTAPCSHNHTKIPYKMNENITITAQDVKDACTILSVAAEKIIKTSDKPILAVSPYYKDKSTDFIGVRVCALGEDFVIEAHDFKGGKYMTWQETMDALKAAGKTTWNYRQICLTMIYRDAIDQILKKHGGDPLTGWYWTAQEDFDAEYSANIAFYYNGSNGNLSNNYKYSTISSRALLALD